MKKIFLILLILFLTGCNVRYELNIKNDSINENISFSLEKKGIKNNGQMDVDVNSDDFINSLISSDISAISNNMYSNKFYYNKEIKQDGNIYNFNLSYEYKNSEFSNSRIVNECFEKHEIRFDDNKTYMHLSGKFNCYQDEPIDITIKSENKIKKANGKKSGNSYTWIIDSSNYENVDIEIETTDESMTRYYIYMGIVIIAGIGIILFIIYFIGRIMGRNSVNEV